MHTPLSRSRPATPPRSAHAGPTPLAVQALDPLPDGKHHTHRAEPARPPRDTDVVHWHPWPAGQMRSTAPLHAPALAQPAAAVDNTPARAVAVRPAAQPPTQTGTASLQEGLYSLIDRLTFRGALAPLLSGCAKWAVAGKAGTGTALEGWIVPAIAGSALQLLAGLCLPGDREHGFHWMGTLLPSAELGPPPSVARWHVYAPAKDQDLLRKIDRMRQSILQGTVSLAGQRTDDPGPLDMQEARLRQRLLHDRDWLNLGCALAMFGALAADVMAAGAAQEDQEAGRFSSGTLVGILTLLLTAFLLDSAAGLWQIRSRSPRPEDYPRPAETPPLRDWAPAGAPAPAARHPGDAPDLAADRRRSDPR